MKIKIKNAVFSFVTRVLKKLTGNAELVVGGNNTIFDESNVNVQEGQQVEINIGDAISDGVIGVWRLYVNGTMKESAISSSTYTFVAEENITTLKANTSSTNTLKNGTVSYSVIVRQG